MHVVLSVTFLIVNILFLYIPICPFVHVNTPTGLSSLGVILNIPSSWYLTIFKLSSFNVPFWTIIFTSYSLLLSKDSRVIAYSIFCIQKGNLKWAIFIIKSGDVVFMNIAAEIWLIIKLKVAQNLRMIMPKRKVWK